MLNLQAGEGGGGAGGGGARRAPPPAASERGDDARRPCEVGAFDPRSAAAAAWRQRYVRTRIEVGDNQIQIGMGDKQNKPENRKWALLIRRQLDSSQNNLRFIRANTPCSWLDRVWRRQARQTLADADMPGLVILVLTSRDRVGAVPVVR